MKCNFLYTLTMCVYVYMCVFVLWEMVRGMEKGDLTGDKYFIFLSTNKNTDCMQIKATTLIKQKYWD